MSRHTKQYSECLRRLPAPGGNGCHQAMFAVACAGAREQIPRERIVEDIRKHLPEGKRRVSDSEIRDAVRNAYVAVGKRGSKRRERPAAAVDPRLLERLITAGRGTTEGAIMARSPIDVKGLTPVEMACGVLDVLYADEEFVFIGDDGWNGELGRTIRRKQEWIQFLKAGGSCHWPKLMLNPLTGRPAMKKSGDGDTLRGDGCIASHRHVLIEHDNLSLEAQLAWWMSVPSLPVVALVFSGKKSIHAIVRVDCQNAEEWEREIENKLFPSYLGPLGFDEACKNASRLTRMPGHVRADTGVLQRCIYLAPKGKAVCSK